MARTSRVLMVAFVATALAADRVSTAAPMLRPTNISTTARQFASRLTTGLRRCVSVVRFQPLRRDERPKSDSAPTAVVSSPLVLHPCRFSPFNFRIPPPVF